MKFLATVILMAATSSVNDASISFSCERSSIASGQPTSVHPESITALIANPTAFDGEHVSFVGVMRFQFDRFSVFPTGELARIEDMPSAITAEVPACVTEEQLSQLDALDAHYVRVRGEFDSNAPGYGGFAAASLIRVYEIVPAETLQ
jgi:hypothetical protein